MPGDGLKILVLAALLGSYACGGPKAERQLDEAPIGTQVIVERSRGERPGWIERTPDEGDGFGYFSGGEQGFTDRALGFRMAKAEAMQALSASLRAAWRSLLQASRVAGEDELESYARSFRQLALDEIRSSAAEPEERYYEKVAIRTSFGIEYRYNAFVLLRLPEAAYRQAQIHALEQLRDRASREGDARAREFFDEAIQRLKAGP